MKKILIFLLITIICISIFIIYIHRDFIVSDHRIVKEIMKNDIYNVDIHIFSVSKNKEFKISEEDKVRFMKLLSELRVKKTYDVINGISRVFKINYNDKKNETTIGISNSIINIGNDSYTITNGTINEFEQLYYKYTENKYN